MSTSIYKTENFKMGCRSITRRSRNTPEKVKRSLFGPIDHEANVAFIERELSLEFNRECCKWNFNFREEVPLDNGDYIWMPPSPIPINRKRKPLELPDNSSAYYFQPIEGNSGTPHLLELLKPIARSPEKSKTRIPKQSLITDYMPKSKRPVVCSKDTTEERPNKIPKLGSYCSS